MTTLRYRYVLHEGVELAGVRGISASQPVREPARITLPVSLSVYLSVRLFISPTETREAYNRTLQCLSNWDPVVKIISTIARGESAEAPSRSVVIRPSARQFVLAAAS